MSFKQIKTAEQIADEKVKQETQRLLSEAQNYLNSTDWYFARLSEIGQAVPDDVLSKRAESRKFIQDNEELLNEQS